MSEFPYDLMNFCVIPTVSTRTTSHSELRITSTALVFNNIAAAELDYPPFVYILVSKDARTVMVTPPSKDTEGCFPQDSLQPFWTGDTVLTKSGTEKKRKEVIHRNRGLARDIRRKLSWSKGIRKICGVRYAEARALYFDLGTAVETAKKKETSLTTATGYLDSLPSLGELRNMMRTTMVPVRLGLPSPVDCTASINSQPAAFQGDVIYN